MITSPDPVGLLSQVDCRTRLNSRRGPRNTRPLRKGLRRHNCAHSTLPTFGNECELLSYTPDILWCNTVRLQDQCQHNAPLGRKHHILAPTLFFSLAMSWIRFVGLLLVTITQYFRSTIWWCTRLRSDNKGRSIGGNGCSCRGVL